MTILPNVIEIRNRKINNTLEFRGDLLFNQLNVKDYELMYDTLDELFSTLDIDPIVEYIDKYKDEKVSKNKNILDDRMKTFFPVLTEVEKKITKMEKHQIVKRKKLFEIENVLEKINETKKLLGDDKSKECHKKNSL